MRSSTFPSRGARMLPRRAARWSAPDPRRPGPRRSLAGAEPPPPARQAGRALSRGGRGPQRTVATGGGMDYLTTFTGKSGRLLRGTASRLWGLGGGGGGGEARQVRFEDYLREPAPGDPGGGPAEHRPPSPVSPEGPGESPVPAAPRLPARGRGPGGGVAPRGRGQVCEPPEDSQVAAWWPLLVSPPRGTGATDLSRFRVGSFLLSFASSNQL